MRPVANAASCGCDTEECPGYAGARRTLGGWGAISGPPPESRALASDGQRPAARIGATPARAVGADHDRADRAGAPLPVGPLSHLVTHRGQGVARLPGQAPLGLELAGRVGVWPERVGERVRGH